LVRVRPARLLQRRVLVPRGLLGARARVGELALGSLQLALGPFELGRARPELALGPLQLALGLAEPPFDARELGLARRARPLGLCRGALPRQTPLVQVGLLVLQRRDLLARLEQKALLGVGLVLEPQDLLVLAVERLAQLEKLA